MNKPTPKKKAVATKKKILVVKKNTKVVSKSVARRVAVQKEADEKNLFVIELKLSYETIVGKGKTIIEALEQFPPRIQPKSRGTMVITSPEKKIATLQMMPVEVNRLFYKPINKVFFQKRMLSVLK